ncbi:unnamed protein product [Adineta steineri]|uniref:EF-hand domain-containing protein n=1 Tax=Adineta steineri TaxID=433720 RepID=A0A814W763_9BILA|nr:unnamed protein product [Adineta steineri]CAF1198237.1 unnamed protein product [Adineta steineri]CAF3547714.1 unnamed protein product [Adineta steineri]CAF3650823.1 unnamed protein product [Adineta steineri]
MKRSKAKAAAEDAKNKASQPRLDWVPPNPALGAQLLAQLENNPLDERSVAGVRLSRDVYKHYTAQEIRDLKEVFDFFDHKHRGSLKPKEIVYVMRTLGVNMSIEQCVTYVEKENQETATLNFGEFLHLLANYQDGEQDDYDELNLAFQLFDIDGRKYIDFNTLRKINQQTSLNLSELELQLMFQAADRNGDNRIDRHEFVRMMRQTNLFSR